MKTLLLVISKDIEPIGKLSNAIGHMMVGIGPRMPKTLPDIQIYFATKEKVAFFRNETVKLHSSLGDAQCVISDFSHTTTKGTAKEHQKQTNEIKENDINYFAACIVAKNESLFSVSKHLNSNDFNKMVAPKKDIATELSANRKALTEDFDKNSFQENIKYFGEKEFVENCDENRFTLVLNKNVQFPEALHYMVTTFLSLTQNIDRQKLRLHSYEDASGTSHPGMSEYGLVVLKAARPASINQLGNYFSGSPDDKIINHVAISLKPEAKTSNTKRKGKGNAADKKTYFAVAFFGDMDKSKDLTKRKISLWNVSSLDEKHFELKTDNSPTKLSALHFQSDDAQEKMAKKTTETQGVESDTGDILTLITTK